LTLGQILGGLPATPEQTHNRLANHNESTSRDLPAQ
jgi:hypothetical protein